MPSGEEERERETGTEGERDNERGRENQRENERESPLHTYLQALAAHWDASSQGHLSIGMLTGRLGMQHPNGHPHPEGPTKNTYGKRKI